MLERCTVALPELVSKILCEALLPVPTLPKLRLVGLAVNWPSKEFVPDPVKATLTVGLTGSLLMMVIPPVTLPAEVGENVTDVTADWPGLIVRGVVIPVTLNSAPFKVTIDRIKFAVPLLLIDRSLVTFDPTDTVPKSMDGTLSDTVGCEVAVVDPVS